MKDFMEFTNLRGTKFILDWSKIVSIAFVRENREEGTPACAIIRIENAGTIEREFENDSELEKFSRECRQMMSNSQLRHSGNPAIITQICPIRREKCLGMDCAIWISREKHGPDGYPAGYCGLIRG